MESDTRQTLLGVAGLTAVMIVALLEGFNGRVTVAYFVSMLAMITPEALSQLDVSLGP